jgi:hypothetical protein
MGRCQWWRILPGVALLLRLAQQQGRALSDLQQHLFLMQ